MKQSRACDECLGVMKHEHYYDGKTVCDDCYKDLLAKDIEAISFAKHALTDATRAMERKTGGAIEFSIDNYPEVYVRRGLDIISRAVGLKPYWDKKAVICDRRIISYDNIDWFETDWEVKDDSKDA